MRSQLKIQKDKCRRHRNQYNPNGKLNKRKQKRKGSAWNLHPESLAQCQYFHSWRMRLAKADVDVDLGVLRIGGALIVDLVIGFERACAA